MPAKPHDRADERLKDIFVGASVCAWCKEPYRAIHCAGLCRSCYSIKLELRSKYASYLARKAVSRHRDDLWSAEHDLIVAIKMAESAQTDGRTYGNLHEGDGRTISLELEFGFISRRSLHKDLFNHRAYLFECFTPSQRRYLMYLVSRMSLEYRRRNRRSDSVYNTDSLEDVMKGRAWGTYRVEDDVRALKRRNNRGPQASSRSRAQPPVGQV